MSWRRPLGTTLRAGKIGFPSWKTHSSFLSRDCFLVRPICRWSSRWAQSLYTGSTEGMSGTAVNSKRTVHSASHLGQLGLKTTNAAWLYDNLPARRERTGTAWELTRDGDMAFVHLYQAHYSSHGYRGAHLGLGPARSWP